MITFFILTLLLHNVSTPPPVPNDDGVVVTHPIVCGYDPETGAYEPCTPEPNDKDQ